MSQKIVINGLGRIGRSILRLLSTSRAGEGFELVALNDIARPELCAYLLEFDSVFGPFPGRIDYDDDSLSINGMSYPLTSHADLADLDLRGVDLLLECTGKAVTRDLAAKGLAAGAGRVLISGPCASADLTCVLGANENALSDHRIVSNASCTTNALAPLLKVLDRAFGLVTGHMTTIHCYTGSQPTIDAPRGDLVRSRAAGLSMIPTTTSAGQLTDLVLPELSGRVVATSVRVPIPSVSAIDLTVRLRDRVDAAQINDVLERADPAVIGMTRRPLVSTDLRNRPESIVMAAPETTVTSGGLVRVFGWYDNEMGFSHRMLDMARLMRA